MAEFHEISPNAPTGEKLLNWVDNRFPLTKLWNDQWGKYYAPKNFNWWYIFGSLAMLVLVIQIVTGIFLVMHYKPDANLAFASVEYIMRDVPWGWLIRYMHSTGASAFFVVVYLHMFRGLIYGSYRKPRELIWIFGCAIFLCLMAEAFMGYLLPWGQMSYWGAQVIVNLFAAIPFIGPDLALLIRGDYVVSDATLNRFFSFHVIAVPLVLLGLVVAHLIALHEVGSNNPDGIEIKANLGPDGHPVDGIPSHPYYSVHDIFGVVIFLTIFSAVIFFAPEAGGYFLEYNNFIPADSLKTPNHIAPVWYFTPFYSMLRAITSEMMYALIACVVGAAVFGVWKARVPAIVKGAIVIAAVVVAALMLSIDAKFWGVVVMGGAVIILFFLPWLDHSPVRSIRYRPTWNKYLYGVFVINFLILGYLGVQPPSPLGERVSQVGSLFYFGFFLLMPWWSRLGTFKPVPERVTFAAH
ncbi:cytochrome b [Variovorax guangxiensis]|uniref:Cytochrome b n=1 Tax=Variovorax guangxiensis TaxID=1775474 RepID=A0A502DWA3_9BURK|nr:cytochrome bc complex cytochrome b subunit [Variovorax guangxiensis]RZI67738.1 MAG: cytochrome bc complex cytochrome b subunit [Variovorax sp.]TPG24200.1 cytochrome bc complex cytochrome b subunit [Variovorax ginsengisoli]TPG28450.1 cytochrome bc complex cytochrome b subunit [Variovorax guangxiensis]